MATQKRYALFDWDNTVRHGYTLYSWVDYLCTHSIIDSRLQYELGKIKEQYKENQITHDQYAKIACAAYTKALSGLHIETIERAVYEYIPYDRKYLFDNVDSLFEMLNKRDVDIVVISGAPSIILEKYKDEFHLKSIYAFKEQVSNDIFTGNVEYNYGFNKRKKVLELIKKYNGHPYMAFGDSKSDVPMLDSAKYAFYINASTVRNYINIDCNNASDEILNMLHCLLNDSSKLE